MSIFAAEMSRSVLACHVNTRSCFNETHVDAAKSPIDRYFETERELNLLCTPSQIVETPIVGGLTLLGSFSAIESYIREVVRELISIDNLSQKACESQPLSFGAARIHDVHMMPEAIMENYSFVSEKSIKDVLKNLLGIEANLHTQDLKTLLKSFRNICQLRHCIVHRAGKLGTRNAIALDLDEHQTCIEKPINLSYANIQEVLQVNGNLVIGLNNFLFGTIITRYTRSPYQWRWDYRMDKKRFKAIYDLFYSNTWPPSSGITSAKEIYDEFRRQKRRTH